MTRTLKFLIVSLIACMPTVVWGQAANGATDEASAISDEIFGPRIKVDEAYGAFQRGFYLTALQLALSRAEQDDGAAQTLVAEIYANGLGVAENYARASSWYALAEGNGEISATFELAMLYQNGLGVPKDRQKAANLFKKAANKGHPEAQYNLALLHVEGAYAEPNLSRAAELLQKAASADIPEALYDYGIVLLEGAGIAPDATAGAQQIEKAASLGLAAAQIDYATLLYLGQGVTQDIKAAAAWYERAASIGNPVAQNRLAKLYAVGEGVTLDLTTAAMWRALARRQGLTDGALDRLLVSISSTDLSDGEERARFWPNKPPSAGKTTAVPVNEDDEKSPVSEAEIQ